MTPDAWGIENGYWDIAGEWHETVESTRRALRVAMGGLADVADPPPATRPVWFVRHGSAPAIDRPAELVLEDGTAAPSWGRGPAPGPQPSRRYRATSPSATTTGIPATVGPPPG